MKTTITAAIIGLALSLSAFAQSGGYMIWNPDGTTTTVIPDGNGNATVWGTGTGYQGQIINNGNGNYQFWENGGGVSTFIPNGGSGRHHSDDGGGGGRSAHDRLLDQFMPEMP